MLTKMRLENFKSWRELDIDLAPITLLFGTNSSGKTSVLQSLLLLKQTANSFDRGQHISFGGEERDYVDFGSYRDLVYGHHEDTSVTIQLEWTKTDFVPQLESSNSLPRVESYLYKIRWHQIYDQVMIENLEYEVRSDGKRRSFVKVERKESGQYSYERPEKWDLLELDEQEPETTEQPESCYKLPSIIRDLRIARTEQGEIFSTNDSEIHPYDEFNSAFETLMENVSYLGPLRHRPQRVYLWTGSAPQTIYPDGGNTIAALIASERKKGDLQNAIANWLTQIGLVDDFKIDTIDRDKRFYETKIKIAGITSALLDVGFGVSQILPIIALLFFAPEQSIILIEQPELHLHPGAQAKLADLFLEVAEKRHLQLIIESHSEHLLRRMQRRIAEVDHPFATPENIKAYFCEAGADGSKIQPVEVDEYGQIHNWPPNFFGDLAGDLDAMMEAAIQRRRQELSSGD